MSKRNSHEAKAARRAAREIHDQAAADIAAGRPAVDIHGMDELTELADRGERLPCGCNAHDLFGGLLARLPDPGPDTAS